MATIKVKLRPEWLAVLIFLFIQVSELYSQSVKRQCISSYGVVGVTDGLLISQTAGQSYGTISMTNSNIYVPQGFQQPLIIKISGENRVEDQFIDIQLYPNPAAYSVVIHSSREIDLLDLKIYDMAGKLLLFEELHHFNNYILNCAGWSDGMYVIKTADSAGNYFSTKLIINK